MTRRKREPVRVETSPGEFTTLRELELNPRPPVVAADRVASYAGPMAITLRFLNAVVMPPTMLHPDEHMLELTNLATVAMHPSVAKRLLVDLQAALATYESRMGPVPRQDELLERWAGGAEPRGRVM